MTTKMSGKNLLEQRIISIDNIYFPVCGVEIETDIFLPRHLRNTELLVPSTLTLGEQFIYFIHFPPTFSLLNLFFSF